MPDRTNPPDAESNIWAFLVGINQYANDGLMDLSGCVNDVTALQSFLQDSLGVAPEHILVLTDGNATRKGILESFRSHLVDNDAIQRGSQLLFAYSGHGSQMRTTDPNEMDGYDETIVPHDARTYDAITSERIRDIPDKTLGALIDMLATAKGDNITVILDCCHSGSGTRDALAGAVAGARRAAPDHEPAPVDLDADLRAHMVSRSGGPSGWAASRENHVLLAGCRDGESSYEYDADEGRFGAMSYFLMRELRQLQPGTTYADLHERVASNVNGVYRAQLPQCEGDRDREVFGGARLSRDPFIVVSRVDGDTVQLASGLIHGLSESTRLAAYNPEVRRRDDVPDVPLATLTVTYVSATTAMASVDPGPDGSRPEIPPHARAIVTERAYAGGAQQVAVRGADPSLEPQVSELLEAIPVSPYLQLSPSFETAQLRVHAVAGVLRITDGSDELLVSKQATGTDVARTLSALESIARFRALSQLRNRSDSVVQGAVGLSLRKWLPDAAPDGMPEVAPDAGGGMSLPWFKDDGDANRYVLEVQNRTPLPVYPHVFYLGSDYSIVRLYPRQGETVAIPAGSTGHPRRPNLALFRVFLDAGQASSRDTIKVVFTTTPSKLGMLQQPELAVPETTRDIPVGLRGALKAAAGGHGLRGGLPEDDDTGEDWGVAELTFDVVLPHAETPLEPGDEVVDLDGGLIIRKPSGFVGSVALRTAGGAARDDTEGAKPPPALRRPDNGMSPLQTVVSRGGGSSGLVVDVTADASARATVTPATPIELALPAGTVTADADVLAVAFDGMDYLVAGSGGADGVVTIGSMPEPSSADAAGTRGAGNLVRFFLYKKLGRYAPDLGLRRLVIENGKLKRNAEGWPVYDTVRPSPDNFTSGQRVAVIVHGFSADTCGMASELEPALFDPAEPCHHVLTFDYETFSTSAATSGEDLYRALRQLCGFDADDGITVHVFAHSMGCLVSRCMIELSQGSEFVDACVLAGPPNCGTPAANVSRGMAFLASALLNLPTVSAPVGLLSLPVTWLTEQGQGWADLKVDSDVIRDLNGLEEPDNVAYVVLAGSNEIDPAAADRWLRLARKTLGEELLFNESNDCLVGASSMEGIRGGSYPMLTVAQLPCDHFSYFGQEMLAQVRDRLP